MKNAIKKLFRGGLGQLTIPLVAIALLAIFNLIRDPGFFSIGIAHNSNGNAVLSGNIISIINGASELAILAIGMTLVTAACGGQDISVGAAAAIAGSVFVKVLKSASSINGGTVLLAFLLSHRGYAVRRVQRNAGSGIQDSADDCDADPVYVRPFHRILD